MDIETAKVAVKKLLENVGNFSGKKEDQGWGRERLQMVDFPVPYLVLFALRELGGLKWWGPEEKLMWGISAHYYENPFSITLEKSGFWLYSPKKTPADKIEEIKNLLMRLSKISESVLRDLADYQIKNGNVTIENLYIRLDLRYKFFREHAVQAYSSEPPPDTPLHVNKEGKVVSWTSDPFKPEKEGGYYAGAMIDSYFSRLEHLLVIVLPFLGFSGENNALVDFVGMDWGEKWKTVFKLDENKQAKSWYESLREIKESFRNPQAHGGFKKKGTSFYFHVPHVGALPALLRGHGKSKDIFFSPYSEKTFEDVSICFDQVDEFMLGELNFGVRFAETGLDIAFSEDFIKDCKNAIESEESFIMFCDKQSYEFERHANFEF